VAERKTQTRRTGTSRRAGGGRGRPDALGRLTDSIEASQGALKDLRSEMSRGSRDVLRDVDKTLRDARKNLRRTSRRIAKDLDEVQQAARGKRTTTARKPAASRRTSARRSTGRRSTARK
jgi:ABC-type transporter Mla subunit MlaD